MPNLVVQAILPNMNAMPKDETINTFHIAASGGVDAVASRALIFTAIENFYNSTNSGTGSIANYIGSSVDRGTNKAQLKGYSHVVGSPLGAPVQTVSWTLGAMASGAVYLPRQCACVLSTHADLSGLPEQGPTVSTIPTPDAAVDEGAPATHSGKTHPAATH